MTCPQASPVGTVIEALVTAPYLTKLSEHAVQHRVGRKRIHPPWVLFAYAALIRHFRSANHTDAELASGLWARLRAAAKDAGLQDPGPVPYAFKHYTYQRDQLLNDEQRRDALIEEFTAVAVDHAQRLGLLRPDGRGSLTYPHPTRTIYGDGTIVRPIYRPPRPHDYATHPETGQRAPRYVDPTTGELTFTPPGRYDPSAADHGRHDGIVHGNNFLLFSVRGDQPNSRVVLGIGRVPAPGQEAETAIRLTQRLHRIAGGGIQAVVYDGALHGTHIDHIMRSTGLIVVNKVRAATRNETGDTTPKRRPLGIHQHQTAQGTCTHTLHVVNGTVVDVALADDGTPVDVATATRKQIKRSRRKDGTYRFNLAVTLPCGNEHTTIWLSPHDNPEHIRLIPPDDPHFTTLYSLRNDAESLNAQYKKTLLVDRATSVGWQRQLFDVLAYSILHNSITWQGSGIRRERPAA